jgi:hypothetical protein
MVCSLGGKLPENGKGQRDVAGAYPDANAVAPCTSAFPLLLNILFHCNTYNIRTHFDTFDGIAG